MRCKYHLICDSRHHGYLSTIVKLDFTTREKKEGAGSDPRPARNPNQTPPSRGTPVIYSPSLPREKKSILERLSSMVMMSVGTGSLGGEAA